MPRDGAEESMPDFGTAMDEDGFVAKGSWDKYRKRTKSEAKIEEERAAAARKAVEAALNALPTKYVDTTEPPRGTPANL